MTMTSGRSSDETIRFSFAIGSESGAVQLTSTLNLSDMYCDAASCPQILDQPV